MIIAEQVHDVLIVGSGAGGGTLAGELVARGRSVLLLERGRSLPLDEQNLAGISLFRTPRYHPPEPWFGPDGDPFAPQMLYALGGNTKIWGGVLQRPREAEFSGVRLQEGTSPDWGLRYADFEPFLERAEQLYRVHGAAGVDPTEPPRHGGYGHAPRPIEPFLEAIGEGLERQGLHPFRLPLSWTSSSADPSGDAERFGVDRASADAPAAGFRLVDGARVLALHVNPAGSEVQGVEAELEGERWLFRGRQVVLAAGAINTPAILLASATASHPAGLANGSGQVGRNLMKLQLSALLQRASEPNSGRYGRSLGVNDYLWGDRNVDYGLGSIQSAGGVLQDPLFAESPPLLSLVSRLLPDAALEWLADRSVSWWAMSSVLPDPDNRVSLEKGRIRIDYLANCREGHDRLVYRWLDTIQKLERDPLTSVVTRAPIYPRGEAPLAVMGYACGTCRMGADPSTSVVDLECRAHGLANLWIADASVLPSCPAVGLGLTVIANALRIAARLSAAL
ncbi:MAG: GMC family oxidoreductase [Cyanobacteria bacterium J06638_7]